jgi:hypothetical protein
MLQASVIKLCELFGIRYYHTFDSRRSAKGWPDLAICGKRGFIARELKTAAGRLTVEQQQWGLILRNAGVSWDVWRPSDLQSGRIQRELEAIR